MVFMQIAVSAIGIGIVVMVGYLVITQVRVSLPITQFTTTDGIGNFTNTINDSLISTQGTIFAGFALVAVGIIVLAAFGLISVFQ